LDVSGLGEAEGEVAAGSREREETFVPSSRTSFYYGPFCGASLAAEGCSIFKRRPSMYVRAPRSQSNFQESTPIVQKDDHRPVVITVG
jgi:hypothetical protein